MKIATIFSKWAGERKASYYRIFQVVLLHSIIQMGLARDLVSRGCGDE
jgi:hypothetical protein